MALWPDMAGQESSHPVTFTSPSQIHKAAVSESSSAFGGDTGVLGGGQGRAAPRWLGHLTVMWPWPHDGQVALVEASTLKLLLQSFLHRE